MSPTALALCPAETDIPGRKDELIADLQVNQPTTRYSSRMVIESNRPTTYKEDWKEPQLLTLLALSSYLAVISIVARIYAFSSDHECSVDSTPQEGSQRARPDGNHSSAIDPLSKECREVEEEYYTFDREGRVNIEDKIYHTLLYSNYNSIKLAV